MSDYKITRFPSLVSTNTYIKEQISALSDKTVIVADVQTAGRGRNNNKWLASDEKKSLAFSVLYKSLSPEEAFLIPVKASLAVSDALNDICGLNTGIKWPNDIITANKKLCGILCSSAVCCDKIDVICGIGINISESKEYFEKNSLSYATSILIETGKAYDKNIILEEILKNMDRELSVSEYKSRCVTLGKQIVLLKNGKKIIAEAVDITDKCELVCKTADGNKFIVNSGEVSVRGMYGYA